MESLFVALTAFLCLIVVAVTFIWSKGRFNALEEKSDELYEREKDVKYREFIVATRESSVDFRERATHEITAKYVLTESDYLMDEEKMMKAIKHRIAMKLGWAILDAIGLPETCRDDQGREVYAFKFRVK